MNGHLFQVGVGSGGIVALDLLARDPRITRVTLVEPDVYKAHNVHRHLFPPSSVGRLKIDLTKEWLLAIRPELVVESFAIDLCDPAKQDTIREAIATCDVGVCAADNEPAKYHFDHLMRAAHKNWTLGEVLSGGIGGWVHAFAPDGPCYGCIASFLKREGPNDGPPAPPPDYANPHGPAETSIPAGKASIAAIAALHALRTLELLSGPPEFSSLLLTLARVPDVFDEPYRTHRFRIPKSPECLLCSADPATAAGEDLDAALDRVLARLAHE
ncbi:MAG: ThiF family adenylyltransferase [Planctomycetia bacterium]|nr:ThiF family adenylyltransferase [Planctomycetia bacterium]